MLTLTADFAVPGLIILSIVIAGVFSGGSSFIKKWKRRYQDSKRIIIEDALKHLYENRYPDFPTSRTGLAGFLSISVDEASELISKLSAMGLAKKSAVKVELTHQGELYALKIIRFHRLLERYVADQTGLQETEWHRFAEANEHLISPDEAEDLAVKLGNPIFDPHGDLIPSVTGSLPVQTGIPLSKLGKKKIAKIVHIEDEPETVYSQIVAMGLHPGSEISMIDNSDKRVVFTSEGEEWVLSPQIAYNITVIEVDSFHKMFERTRTLSTLKIGEKAKIKGISPGFRGQQRRRLLDLGIIRGAEIKAELKSSFGDTIAYDIKGTKIALRKSQTDMIFIY